MLGKWFWNFECDGNDFEIGEMEMNDELKTKQIIKLMMVNVLKIVVLVFGST